MAMIVSRKVKQAKFLITSGRAGIEPLADTKWILEKYRYCKEYLGDRLIYKSGLNKKEYYEELAKTAVVWSSSLQENFGYAILEATTLNCTPVLPNRVVYPELYSPKYIYDSLDSSIGKVLGFLENPDPCPGVGQAQARNTNNIVIKVLVSE